MFSVLQDSRKPKISLHTLPEIHQSFMQCFAPVLLIHVTFLNTWEPKHSFCICPNTFAKIHSLQAFHESSKKPEIWLALGTPTLACYLLLLPAIRRGGLVALTPTVLSSQIWYWCVFHSSSKLQASMESFTIAFLHSFSSSSLTHSQNLKWEHLALIPWKQTRRGGNTHTSDPNPKVYYSP